MTPSQRIIDGYNAHAPRLFRQYNALPFEAVHAPILTLLPPPNTPMYSGRHLAHDRRRTVLDLGAGSGRDAAWFAARRYRVTAVEPASGLRIRAERANRGADIRWIDAALPSIPQVCALDETFDIIMVSAVWAHLPAGDRERAMATIAALSAPYGRIFLSVRQGPGATDRPTFPVAAAETNALATSAGLTSIFETVTPSVQAQNQMAGVTWRRHCFVKPREPE